MSEYIVKLPMSGAADEFIAKHGVDDCRLYGYKLTGEIIRCRDCKHYITKFRDEYDDTVWCGLHAGYVEPDGFCAWGERRAQ